MGATDGEAEPARVLRLPAKRDYKYDPPDAGEVEVFEVGWWRWALEEVVAVLPPAATVFTRGRARPFRSSSRDSSRAVGGTTLRSS
jgi:hypothetical protein